MKDAAPRSLWRWFNTPPQPDAPVVALILFRLRWALAAILTLAVLAMSGYVLVEGYGWMDAIYMTRSPVRPKRGRPS